MMSRYGNSWGVGRFLVLPLSVALFFCDTPKSLSNPNVYVSRFWHNHQPLYWPEWNSNGTQTQRGQYAWDSIVLKPGQNYGGLSPAQHPENNLTEIFSVQDRVTSYQSAPRNSLNGLNSAAGFALSYSGSLIDNVRQLGSVGQLGYGSGWNTAYREAHNWRTPTGARRLDMVGFTYHHSLAPLLPKSVFRKELQIFKQAWWKAWGGNSDLSDHSKGFFPTEMAYSRHLIDVLREEGYEWVIVPSHHISRTCPTYNTKANPEGSYNIFSSPPNKADQLGPSPTNGWWYSEPNPGNAAWNVAPYAYQLHRVKYVNPETGAEKTMFTVPSDDVLSYRYGYANEGVGKIDTFISPFAGDASRPVIVMPSTDGDNAWGGGSSSWFEATPQLFNDSAARGYRPSAPQDFVNAAVNAAGGTNNVPIVHIEDGAWIFPEMCYGSPNFMKWIEPPVATVANRGVTTVPGTQIDMESPGFALKFYSYAPLMAGANWCETAEQILRDEGGEIRPWVIQAPYDWSGTGFSDRNDVELAWHIYLKGLDSGFNYYGGLGNDDEMKPGLATRRAVEKLTPWMTTARRNNDRTPPTVLKPQRFPYNPGGYTFGWFNQQPQIPNNAFLKRMNSDFYIWTHAYDLNGISNIVVKVRFDKDGTNPVASNQNETYGGGSEVETWQTLSMTKRELPKTREALNAAAANSQINYFLPVQPDAVADYYFVKITDTNLAGFRNKLLDYYIEATDSKGNLHKSEIQHVWVDDYSAQTNGSGGGGGGGGGGGTSGPVVTSPSPPVAGQTVTVTYTGNLASGTSVNIHHGYNGGNWTTVPGVPMTKDGEVWKFTYNVPSAATNLAMVFNFNGQNPWDNNGGLNYNFSVTNLPITDPPDAPTGFSASLMTSSNVVLSWEPSATASSYILYRDGQPLATPASTIFTNTGLQPETTYNYSLWAVNGVGQSYQSTGLYVTTPFAPLGANQLRLLNPTNPAQVSGGSFLFRGRAGSAFTNGLTWSNSGTGASGSVAFPIGNVTNGWEWSTSILLGAGSNNVTFTGSYTGSPTQTFTDSPSNYTAWSNGATGGNGFGVWTLTTAGSAGNFYGSTSANTDMNVGSVNGFGLWANPGGTSTARRDFNTPMAAGDSFALRLDNGNIAGGAEVGFALADSSGNTRFRFYFVGGSNNYSITDTTTNRNSGWAFTSAGLSLTLTLNSSNTYTLYNGTTNLTGTLASSGGAISRLIVENKSAGGGNNLYFGSMSHTRAVQESGSNSVTAATLTYTPITDGIANSWWALYFADSSSWVSLSDPDGDGFTNAQENALGTTPTDASSTFKVGTIDRSGNTLSISWPSVVGKKYQVQKRASLNSGAWVNSGSEVTASGTNSSAIVDVSDSPNASFVRVILVP